MKAAILILICSALSLQAQTSGKAPLARFRTLGLGVSTTDLFYSLKDKDVAVGVAEDTRSDFYELPPGGKVDFFRISKEADASVVRTPVVSVPVAEGGAMPLLIFSQGPSGPADVVVEVLADDPASFPGGTFRVLNRTDVPLGCLLGGTPTVVPARGVRLLDRKPDEGVRTLVFQVYPVGTKSSQPIYSNNWAWKPVLRTMVVAAPPIPPATVPSIRRIVESTELLSAPQVPETAPTP